MKRTLATILAFAAILCAASSCKSDKCKCTTTIEIAGNKTTTEAVLDLGEKTKCSDLDSKLGTTTVTCKAHHE